MPRRRKQGSKAAEAPEAAIEKLIEDDDLRASLKDAYDSARDAYDRAVEGNKPAKAAPEDAQLRQDLRAAADSLRAATDAFNEPDRKSGGHGLVKLVFVAFVAAVIAVVLSEDLRKGALDRLFGAEEEFEYTSTTTPSAPPTPSG